MLGCVKSPNRTGLLFLLALVLLLAGCQHPRSLETEATIGTIVDVRRIEAGPPGQYTLTMMFWGEFGLLPITISTQRQMKDSYVYSIRSADNQAISTQSYEEFQIDDCVVLHHQKYASIEDARYSFMAGTLKSSTDCI